MIYFAGPPTSRDILLFGTILTGLLLAMAMVGVGMAKTSKETGSQKKKSLVFIVIAIAFIVAFYTGYIFEVLYKWLQ